MVQLTTNASLPSSIDRASRTGPPLPTPHANRGSWRHPRMTIASAQRGEVPAPTRLHALLHARPHALLHAPLHTDLHAALHTHLHTGLHADRHVPTVNGLLGHNSTSWAHALASHRRRARGRCHALASAALA
eukprot:CAMPEP_0183333932 /NCGR_PEP_ID=MMETSP0164_2-20130417/2683_1 /TAXON_ID=221442 /ORGANISM="Coccolithus pelagicus ssp braarudi, Strain PLY182g" /LENGTH=131 /DNA_ID=CAMNT_0025502963 /DNA_START=60 /DNA_END=451 /DNA_ORIENTATION=+